MDRKHNAMSRSELENKIIKAAISGDCRMLNDVLSSCEIGTRGEILQDHSFLHSVLSRTLQSGHVDIIVLLEKNYDVDFKKIIQTDGKTCSILCDVLSNNHLSSLDYVLVKGADVNQQCDSHGTPLILGCTSGNIDQVEKLVKHGAWIDGSITSPRTPLMLAVQSGRLEIVQYLLQKGADSNRRDEEGITALHDAVRLEEGKDIKLVKLLLQHKAEQIPNNEAKTPLILAANLGKVALLDAICMSREEKVTAMELDAVLQAPHETDKLFNCLQKAMEVRYSDPSNILHKPDQVLDPALGYTIESRSPKELSERKDNEGALLMECLAMIKRLSNHKIAVARYTRICEYMFGKCHHKELSYLLRYDPNDTSNDKSRWLREHSHRFKVNVQKNKKVEFSHCMMYLDVCLMHLRHLVPNNQGRQSAENTVYPVLDTTVEYLALCVHLLDRRNKKDVKDLKNKTAEMFQCLQVDGRSVYSPLNMALHQWTSGLICRDPFEDPFYTKLVNFLIEQQAPVNCLDKDGNTPLHIVAESSRTGSCDVARRLLALGAALDTCNSLGQTPVQCALTEDMSALLLSAPRR